MQELIRDRNSDYFQPLEQALLNAREVVPRVLALHNRGLRPGHSVARLHENANHLFQAGISVAKDREGEGKLIRDTEGEFGCVP